VDSAVQIKLVLRGELFSDEEDLDLTRCHDAINAFFDTMEVMMKVQIKSK